MDELKPCPFCKWRGKLLSHEMTATKTLWWVQCSNSHCRARRAVTDSRLAAILEWNERTA